MPNTPSILTTVVGSYPIPAWLAAMPSTPSLADAILVVVRTQEPVKILGLERIRWVHPDCGFWMLHRSVADRKMRALVEGRDRFLARSR